MESQTPSELQERNLASHVSFEAGIREAIIGMTIQWMEGREFDDVDRGHYYFLKANLLGWKFSNLKKKIRSAERCEKEYGHKDPEYMPRLSRLFGM